MIAHVAKMKKLRQLSTGNFEGVARLYKEVVKQHHGEQDRQRRRPIPCEPGGGRDRQSKNRHFHIAELVVLKRKGEPKCNPNASD